MSDDDARTPGEPDSSAPPEPVPEPVPEPAPEAAPEPAAVPEPTAAPPAPPESAYAQPPAYAPAAPAYAPPPPPAPPAKKSRKGLWISIALVVFLLLCVGGSCIGWLVYSGIQEQKAYDEANRIVKSASTEFTSAVADIPAGDTDAIARDLPPALDDMREAGKKARAIVEPLSDSDQKRSMLKVLASLDRILDQGDKIAEASGKLDELVEEMKAIVAIVNTADNATGDGINAANNKRWSEAESNAATAIASYNEAIGRIAELEKAWPGVGMSDWQRIVEKKRLGAEKVAALAPLGRSGKVSSYNKLINEFNDLQKEIRNSELPAFANDSSLLTKDISDALDEIQQELVKLSDLMETQE